MGLGSPEPSPLMITSKLPYDKRLILSGVSLLWVFHGWTIRLSYRPGWTIRLSYQPNDPVTPGCVSTKNWEHLLAARRRYCNDQFQHDCKELLFFIADGRVNNFFGYPDETAYWRDGLCLEPEAVPFAENYLRTHMARLEASIDGKDQRKIPFNEAVELGKKSGGAPIGNNNASKNNPDTIKVVSKAGGYGTFRAYVLARLKGDRPDLAQRVMDGDYAGMPLRLRPVFVKSRFAVAPNCGHEW